MAKHSSRITTDKQFVTRSSSSNRRTGPELCIDQTNSSSSSAAAAPSNWKQPQQCCTQIFTHLICDCFSIGSKFDMNIEMQSLKLPPLRVIAVPRFDG